MLARLSILLLLVVTSSVKADAQPLTVFASIIPVQTFIKAIGGDHVEARVMVQPGYSPATYDPTPQQISALAKAKLYARVGVPFEDAWMKRIQAASPAMAVVDLREGLKLREMEAHHHHDEHEDHAKHDEHEKHDKDHGHDEKDQHHKDEEHGKHGGHAEHDEHHGEKEHHEDHHEHGEHESDPHIWTSPKRVIHMLGVLKTELARLDPAHADVFEKRYEAYKHKLEHLDESIRAKLEGVTQRRFLIYHPSWGYFADDYGLTQVPIEHEGKQAGARAVAQLIQMAKDEDIRVIFVQPQFDRRQAKQVARAIDGQVLAIDPLASNYVENLEQVADAFARTLKK